jgi:hypothetical protein
LHPENLAPLAVSFHRGLLRRHIQLDRTQVHTVLGREFFQFLDLWRIAAGWFAHAGVDGVTRTGQGTCSRAPEPFDSLVMTMTFFMIGSLRVDGVVVEQK